MGTGIFNLKQFNTSPYNYSGINAIYTKGLAPPPVIGKSRLFQLSWHKTADGGRRRYPDRHPADPPAFHTVLTAERRHTIHARLGIRGNRRMD